MNDLKKRYRETVNAVGVSLLAFVMLYVILTNLSPFVKMLIPKDTDAVAAEVTLSIVSGATYLAAFMLPAAFFFYLMRGSKRESMRLDVKLSSDTFPIIFAGVACIFALSYFNGMFMSFFEAPVDDIFHNEPNEYISDYNVILQFITIAIVPAFCEEFLFRGVILSNLMPYGKGVAIIGSSLLFALMHGNFYQFLYTAAAGIILGTVYVLTDSIWCSIFVHLINNSTSVLQSSLSGRVDEYTASVILTLTEGVIFIVGLLSVVFLVVKRGKRAEGQSALRGVFGVKLEATSAIGFGEGMPASDAIRLFFSPSILMFMAYSIINAILRLV